MRNDFIGNYHIVRDEPEVHINETIVGDGKYHNCIFTNCSFVGQPCFDSCTFTDCYFNGLNYREFFFGN